MGDNGAGQIGNYSHCTFASSGEGSFKPLKGSDPFLGEAGEIEKVKEMKLEAIVSSKKIRRSN